MLFASVVPLLLVKLAMPKSALAAKADETFAFVQLALVTMAWLAEGFAANAMKE